MPWIICTENHYNHYDITHYLKRNGQFNTTGNLQRSSEVLREAIIPISDFFDIYYSIEKGYWGGERPSC